MKGKIQPSIQSLPRELNLPKDRMLRIRSLRELGQPHSNQKQEANITIKDDAPYVLKGTSGDTMELEITFTVPSSSELGVRVLCGEDGNNGFTITTGSMRKTPTVGYIKPPFELKQGKYLILRVFSMVEVFTTTARPPSRGISTIQKITTSAYSAKMVMLR